MIKILKKFGYLIKPYFKYGKFYLIGSVLLISCINPISTYVSIFLQQTVIDSLGSNKSFIHILIIIVSFQILLLLCNIANEIWFRLYGEKKFVKISANLNVEIMNKILHVDYRYFDNPMYYNAYTWAAREYASKVEGARQVLTGMFSCILTIATLVTYISISNLIILFATILILIVTLFINTRINRINVQKQESIMEDDRKIGYVQRVFNTKERVAELLSSHVSDFLFGMYYNANDSKVTKIEKSNKTILILNIISNVLLVGLNLFVMAYLIWQILHDQVSLGGFVGMLTASNLLRGNLQRLFNGYKQIHEFAVYSDKIQEFMQVRSNIESHPTLLQETNKSVIGELPYDIEICNLSFSYPNSNFSLRNINLYAHKGEKIAIVGENGAGKTTLTKLLLRLYDPDEGTICYNGKDVCDLPIKALRLEVGVAFQQSGLYALPFIENLLIYAKDIDNIDIGSITSMFGFDSVFEKNASDINTCLTKEFDKKGIVLSGGEIQRLALARLFTKQFGLLILDEASSALDPIAEYELNKKLFELANGTTTIMVAHRLSTVRNVDRIYVIDKGTVLEYGTHDQLMSMQGKYYSMFTKQAENYQR